MEQTQIFESIGYLLARICHAQRQNVNGELSKYDLHVGQEMFLLYLWQGDGVTQSDLADHLCLQQATVTTMLKRMTKAGLVERRKDPEDRRVSRVYLTQAGRRLREPVLQLLRDNEMALLVNFTMDERVLLRRLLIYLYDNIKS